VFVGDISLFYLRDRPHIIVKDSDPIFVADIFINKKIAAYLSNHFKIHASRIIFVGFRVNNFLTDRPVYN
jgi:hypothetical protein